MTSWRGGKGISKGAWCALIGFVVILGAAGAVYYWGLTPPPEIKRGVYPIPKDVEVATCPPGKPGATIVLSSYGEPKTFHPLVEASSQNDLDVQNQFLCGLVVYNPVTQTNMPALAKSWTLAPDKKTYTFHLREGLKWNDGAPFNADDVIFTFDCIFAEVPDAATGKTKMRYPNRYAQDMSFSGEHVTYRKIDEYTVEFYTPKVYSPFLDVLAGPILILPKHKLEASFKDGTFLQQWTSQTAIDHPEELVGMGPFMVSKYTPGERIEFSANPHYWRVDSAGTRLPYIDFVVLQFAASYENEVMLFSTGQIDSLMDYVGIPPTDEPWVKKGEKIYDFTVYTRGPRPSSWFMWFNQHPGTNKEGKPYLPPYKLAWYSNKLFRQAIMYGIDRPGIARGVYFGRGEPEKSFINQGNPKWFNPNVKQYDYNPAKSRELLKEAGFRWDADGKLLDSAGNRVEINLLLYEGVRRVIEIATVFKENMKDLGIEVKLSLVDFTVVIEKTSNSYDYEMTGMGWGSSGGEMDPAGHKVMLRSDGAYHHWNPKQTTPATDWEKRIDEIYDAQELSFDTKERLQMFYEVQEILAEQIPLFYMVDPLQYQGIKNKWKNLRIPPSGTLLWNLDELWAEPEIKDK